MGFVSRWNIFKYFGEVLRTFHIAQNNIRTILIHFTGNEAAARMLIENGAPVSAKDSGGLTPMMVAASKNLAPIVQLLEQRGASIRVT